MSKIENLKKQLQELEQEKKEIEQQINDEIKIKENNMKIFKENIKDYFFDEYLYINYKLCVDIDKFKRSYVYLLGCYIDKEKAKEDLESIKKDYYENSDNDSDDYVNFYTEEIKLNCDVVNKQEKNNI